MTTSLLNSRLNLSEITSRYCKQEGDECDSSACSDTYCTALGGNPNGLAALAERTPEELRTECLGAMCATLYPTEEQVSASAMGEDQLLQTKQAAL